MKTKTIILIFSLLLVALKVTGQCDISKVVGGAVSICSGSSTNITVAASDLTATYQLHDGTSTVGSPVAGTGGLINLPTGNLTSATTFSVLVAGTSPVCSATLTQTATVTINPLTGIPVFTQGATALCKNSANETYTATASNGTIAYSVLPAGAGTIDSDGLMHWDNTYSGIATITATATGLCGTTSADIVVTIYPGDPADAGAITGPANVCYGESSVVYSVGAITDALTYTWTLPAGVSFVSGEYTTSITVNFAPGASSPRNIKVKGTNPCGSGAEASKSVIIYGQLQGGTISGNQSVCYNTVPGQLSGVAPTGGNAPYLYQWQSSTDNVTFGDISGATGLNYTPGALMVTTYYRQVQTSASSCGNVTTNTVTVSVYGNLVAGSISGDQTICYNTVPGQLSGVAPTGGNTPYTYKWQSSTDNVTFGDISGATSLNYTPGALMVTTYFRQVQTSASGCGNLTTNTVTVTVYGNLVAGSISGNQSLCYNTVPGQLSGLAPTGGNTPYTYKWQSSTDNVTFGDVSGATGLNYTPGALMVTTYYRQVQTSASGCGNVTTNTVTVSVYGNLVAGSISGNQSICYNTVPGQLSVVAPTGGNTPYTYKWQSSTDNVTFGDVSGATSLNYTPGALMVTTYFRQVQTSASGCGNVTTNTVSVIVSPLPTLLAVTQNAQICSGSTATINLTGLLAGSTSSVTYKIGTDAPITVTGLSAPTGNTSFSTGALAAVNNGKYLQITGITNEGTGCSATFTQSTILVVNSATVPTLSGDFSPCVNSINKVYTTESGMNAGTYNWTFSGGGTYTGGGVNDNTITVNWTTAATHTISVIYTNSNGCTAASPAVKNVTVNPLPTPTISGPVSACINSSGNVYNTQAGMTGYVWTIAGGVINSGGNGSNLAIVTWNTTGSQSISVNYTNSNGCTALSPINYPVTVNPLPLPTFISAPATARVTSDGNVYSTESGMNNYLWTVSAGGAITAGGTSASDAVTVTWNTAGAQSVSVKYTNTNNCTALTSTTTDVTVNPLPSVSNVQISGTPAIGYTLTGSYSYTDGGSGSSISTFRWLRNGTTQIGGATLSYIVQSADLNNTITFEVTPVTSAGTPNTGIVVKSNPTIPVENLSEIPVADQVCIEGVRTAGNALRGKYRFIHSKPEGASTYKWYINGVAIPSATGIQYTLLPTDIDNDENITFEVTPVSSNVIPVNGISVESNPMSKIPLLPTEYSVAVSAVPLTASPANGIFSGPGVTNGVFSPSSVGIAGSPYSIQYLLNIVNSSTSCSQTVWKTVSVVTNNTEFSSFKPVYCQTEDVDEIVVTGLLTGLTSVGFYMTDPDAIVSSTSWTVTIDPKKMRPGNNKDVLYFKYKDVRGYEYQISKSFVVDSVGKGVQIINLNNEYCAETPKVNITVTGTYPSGGTGAWTSSLLTDLAATSASVDVSLVPAGPTYPVSYRYTSPLGCNSIVINRSVTVNPLPNPSFLIAPFYNIDGGPVTLVPVQSPGAFSGDGVSGDKLYPDIAGLGEHTINYRIKDIKGCIDDLNIKTIVKKAQGTFTDIPSIVCYRDTTFNVKVTGLPTGMSVNSFVNTRNSIDHIVGATDANYNIPAAGHGLDTLTFSYKLDGVNYWISKVVNIDSLGLVQVQNLFAGDKVCDNRAPFELFTSLVGGVFTGPVAGNYLDPTKAMGSTSVSYKYTNSRTGCSSSTTVPFSIIPAPKVSFVPKDVCIESTQDSTFFLNTTVSSDPVYEWAWTFAEIGAAPSDRKEPGFLYKTGGIHTVSLNVKTISGCTVTKTSNIDLGIRPIADFTWKNDCYAPGAKLNLSDATFTNFPVISRTWSFNSGSLTSTDLNPEYSMQDTGYINVRYIVRTSYANCADTVSKKIYIRPTVTIPKDGFYSQNFETGKAGWGKDESDIQSSWQFGKPNRTIINKAKSGTAAWFTKYESVKLNSESSSVISPCFDFKDIQRPMITLQAFKIFEKNRNGAALQYKTEEENAWKYVGTLDDGINWYNSTLINGKPGGEKIGWTTLGETGDVDYVSSSHALDELKGKKNVKFRIAYGSDGISADKEGIAFDDIWIGERTRKVLLEHFTNTFSRKGSEATTFVNKITKGKEKDIINIQYHTNFPDDDPFYLVNPGDASARIFSYGLSRVPYSLIDGGYNNVLYASLSDYKTAPLDSNNLSRRSLMDSPVTISLIPKITGGVLTVNSTVTAVNAFTSDNLVLYLAVTERENDKERGALGETIFRNVFRKFIPDAGGIDLKKTWTTGETFSIPEKTWVIENIKNFSDIEVIAFIQNSQTKEVYQSNSVIIKTGKSALDNSIKQSNAIGSEDKLPAMVISFGLYPNPTDGKLRIEFSDKLQSDADVIVFDFQGAVKSLFKVASGESNLFIEDVGLKAGIYLVRVSSGGIDLGFRKLIISGD